MSSASKTSNTTDQFVQHSIPTQQVLYDYHKAEMDAAQTRRRNYRKKICNVLIPFAVTLAVILAAAACEVAGIELPDIVETVLNGR